MFHLYIDVTLALLVIGAFGAIWVIGGNAASAERREK
jgi:hypothetical protein